MKVASALLLIPAVNGFAPSASVRSESSLSLSLQPDFSASTTGTSGFPVSWNTEGVSFNYEYAPLNVPEVAPMDLVYVGPQAGKNVKVREIGAVPGFEQKRFSGQLLGLDAWYQPSTMVLTDAGPVSVSQALRKFKPVKCYQTSKKIYRQTSKYAEAMTPAELLNPDTNLIAGFL